MVFKYDATGVDPNGGYPIIDKPGWYPFRIITAAEGKSKNGNYQVTVDCACLDQRYKDYGVRHWVTFLSPESKGAGMAIHFLKCIGEEYEGVLNVEPLGWERKCFMGKVEINEYDGKRNNKFSEISPIKEDDIEAASPTQKSGTVFDE